MKSYRIFTILTLFAFVFAMVACTTQTATPAQQQEQTTEKKVVIGFSQVTLDSPFYVELMKAAQAEAEKSGAELVYLDAQNNIEKQIKDIQDLITRGVDVMILNAVNPESIAPAVEALNKANIPIVTVDRPITPKVASFVGRDNFEMGRLSGEYAAKLLNGKGKIIEIQGAAGDKVMMARRDGFHSVIDKYPDIQVIQSPYSDYVRSKAVTAFQDMIQANPDVNLVYAHNDDMALGAVQVLESQKITGVKVVGVDCLMEAVKAIKDGRYDSTTANDPQYLGTVAVQVALKVLKGEKVGEYIDTGTTLITKDNVDQYVGNTGTFCTYTPTIDFAGGKAAEQPATEPAASTTEKKVVIGFSQVTLDSPFYVELMKAAQAEAEKSGAELVYLDAQNNIEKQIKDIQDLITRGVDVMILNAVNPESIVPAVNALNDAGIKIVTVDRPITPKVASFVGRDNFEMGRLSGEYAAKLLNGKGKIIEIQGAAGDKVMMARRDGFHSVIDKYPDIQVIQSPYSDYVRSKAVTAFQDMIQANPDVNLVYAHNDDMALGAVQVLESQKITGVKVVGVDCLMEAVKAIKDGRYDSTTANDPQYLGTVAVQVALRVLAGEKVPEYVDTGTTLITKDNVDQYVGNTGTFCTYTPEIKW